MCYWNLGESTRFLSGAAVNSLRLWDTETGITLSKFETKSAVRTCGISFCGNKVMMSTDKQMGHECKLYIFDIREGLWNFLF